MKKSFISVLLAVSVLFTALPLTAFAADTQTAGTGDALWDNTPTFNSYVTVNADYTVTVTWDPVFGAAKYVLWLTNKNPDNGAFCQVNMAEGVSADATRSVTFSSNYVCDYGYGSMDYRVDIAARNSGDDYIAHSYSRVFQTGMPILAKPSGSMNSSGVVTWTAIPNAKEYSIVLYTSSGYTVTGVSTGKTTFDFSSYVTPGNQYYFELSAGNPPKYRKSAVYTSELVRIPDTRADIAGLKWQNYVLKWDAYQSAVKYQLYLYKFDSAKNSYVLKDGPLVTSSCQCDFTSRINQFGQGKYRVAIFAVGSVSNMLSHNTQSPVLDTAISNTWIENASVSITAPVGGAKPDMNPVPKDPAAYSAELIYWYLDEGPAYPHLTSSDTFTAGKKYRVRIKIEPKSGYCFDSDTAFSIEGYKATYVGALTYEVTFTADQPTYIVSGTITSFLDNNDDVIVRLRKQNSWTSRSLVLSGNKAGYMFIDVSSGFYTLSVSKENHVLRSTTVSVSGNRTVNMQINPLGDINGDGKVTTADFGMANSHARSKSTLTGYAFSCADINDDGSVTTADAGRINSHARGKTKLW